MKKATSSSKPKPARPKAIKQPTPKVVDAPATKLSLKSLVGIVLIGIAALVMLQISRDARQRAALSIQASNGPTMLYTSKVLASSSYAQNSPPFTLESGFIALVVDVQLTNQSSVAQWFAPVLQSWISDTDNNRYTLKPYSLDNPFIAGEYPAGQTVQGQLSYHVPVASKHHQWCYQISTIVATRQCHPLDHASNDQKAGVPR